MPASAYNRYFGGEGGSAAKARRAMQDKYGATKGESVFHGYIQNEKKGKPHRSSKRQYPDTK